MYRLLILIICVVFANVSTAAISVFDDDGNQVLLDAPAKRVVSLSPGSTELIFAAGGGDAVKGVVSYSDYPPAANTIPQVGSYNAVDIEKILELNPDLIVAWKSGNPPLQISKLKKLGLNVYVSEPRNFENITSTIHRLGVLLGTEKVADAAMEEFQLKLGLLKQRYAKEKSKPKTVFIQIWNEPLMTINGDHLISKIVEFCSGRNIFHDVESLTINLDAETVLQKNPGVILVSRDGKLGEQWLSFWKQWQFVNAVKNQQLFAVNPDYLVRHTPRIINGIEQVCRSLQPHISD